MKYRIRWANKNFDDMGTLTSNCNFQERKIGDDEIKGHFQGEQICNMPFRG